MEYLAELDSDTERFEAEALVQFEAQGRRKEIEQIGTVPVWFIPPYQVQRGEYIASGSFGSVYRGRWLDTDVAVKRVLTNCTLPMYRDQFRHELDLWFSLNHENLIKLYGAFHEGQPFFVCELAVNGTLPSFLRGKNRLIIWDSLWYAARALGHLHDRGIVHGDLKGYNILVGEDQTKVKLTDFGLSFLSSNAGGGEEQLATRVVRWKAPECLLGALPTFASDVYSFAMCTIEVVSGEYPWGPKLADAVVAQNVANRKQIPPRPKPFRDDEWDLIELMCCFDPSERISMAAVSRIAYEIGSNWEMN